MASDHFPPQPFGADDLVTGGDGGVLCPCGATWKIGGPYPDTRSGTPSKRKLKTLADCNAAYQDHWSSKVQSA